MSPVDVCLSYPDGIRKIKDKVIVSAHVSNSSSRFYSDPGVGNVYMGISPEGSGMAVNEQKMQSFIAAERIYDGNTGNIPWTKVDASIAAGRIPVVSWKNAGRSMQSIAAGEHDAWIDAQASAILQRAPWPFYFTFYHEPENDQETGGDPFDATLTGYYRAAQRRIAQRIKATAYNAVFVCTYYMNPHTLTGGGGRDWREFYPDWIKTGGTGLGTKNAPDPNDFYLHGNPNSVVDIIGVDQYILWGISDPLSNYNVNAPQNQANELQNRTGFLNKPYAVGEWGAMVKQSGVVDDGTLTQEEYMQQYNSGQITIYADDTRALLDNFYNLKDRNYVLMCWWDNDLNNYVYPNTVKLSEADPLEIKWSKLGEYNRRSSSKKWTNNGVANANAS